MESFTIRSRLDDTKLVLSHGVKTVGEGYLRTSFASENVTAAVDLYDLDFDHWPAFFKDIATHWKGWPGAKEPKSVEGHLESSVFFLESKAGVS